MTSFYDSHDYYKRMLELQEKLRKSEEERIRLEERFKILVQESRNRHDACINRLRLRYIEFLEEQRTRDERNHKLLEALDRVDGSLALMTAKTDRLNILRKQYEAYLRRAYAIRSPPGSIIGDTDVASQNEHRYSRMPSRLGRFHLSSEINHVSSPQTFPSNHQAYISVPPSASKFSKSTRNTYYNNRQPEIVQSRIPNQQINISQSTLQTQVDPTIQLNSVQQLPSQNLTPQISHHRQPYYSNNVQFASRNFQINPSHRVPYVLDPQMNSFSQQSGSLFNKSPTERMETVQALSHLVKPERTNGNVSRYNSVDMSETQFTPEISQHHVNPSPVTQSFRVSNSEAPLDNLQMQRNNSNDVSPGFRAAPTIAERSLYGTGLLYTPLNLARQSFTSYLDRSSEHRQNFNDVPTRSVRTLDEVMKRQDRFTPKRSLLTGLRQTFPEEEVDKTTRVLENELDRYIDKIRKLHLDHNAENLEEVDHEQNTSGDILNVTLSDDDDVPREEKPREDLPKEVEKVLALADDLAFGMVNLNDANDSGKECRDENRNLESIQAAQSDTPMSEGSHTPLSGMHEGRARSEALAKDKISGDIVLHRPELDSHENIGKPAKQNSASLVNIRVPEQDERQQSEMQNDESNGLDAPLNKVTELNGKDSVLENVQKDEQYAEDIVHVGEELNLEQYSFDALDELKPWDLDDVQKGVREVDSSDGLKDLSVEKESVVDVVQLDQSNTERTESSDNTVKDQTDKIDFNEDTNIEAVDLNDTKDEFKVDTEVRIEENSVEKNATEVGDASLSECQELERNREQDTSNVDIQENTKLAEDKLDEQERYDNEKNEYNESNDHGLTEGHEGLAPQQTEYSDQNYVEGSDQMQNYAQNPELDYTDLNAQYNYDQNAPYETNQSQEYQEYSNQEYAQQSNEQYEGYTNEQYEQYANDPENQYEQDPNAQYQEDPNQQYAYTYDQQYDPNQVYETDVNQQFEYTETYDPNQTELVQEPEQSQEPDKLQEKSEDREVEDGSEKVDANQDKNEKLDPENEPKKKKDVIKSLLDSDTDSTIERNVSNTESDFDFN